MPPVIDKKKCIGCNTCAEICPLDVIRKVGPKQIPDVRYPEECWHCNSCVLDCPAKAISLRIPMPATLLYVDAPGKGQKQ